MEFQYATKTITLPVSGLEAEIRESEGHANKILHSKGDQFHEALPDYWAYLTRRLGEKKPTRQDILNLLRPDQRFLAIEIFRLSTLDDSIILSGPCNRCGKSSGYKVQLSELKVTSLPPGAVPPDPTFQVLLPRTRQTAVFGYVTGQQELEERAAGDFDPARLLNRAVRSLNGQPASYEDVAALPNPDLRALAAAIESKVCGYDTIVDFICPHCKKMDSQNILTDPSFVMPTLAGLEPAASLPNLAERTGDAL